MTKVTISVAPSSRAPAGDYVLSRNRVLTIAAGATTSTGTVTVAAVDNDRDEPDRWVVLRGTPQNSQGTSQYAGLSLAIDDDEAAPAVTLAVADGAVDEDGGTTTVTATLSHASSEATTITVTALDGAYTVGYGRDHRHRGGRHVECLGHGGDYGGGRRRGQRGQSHGDGDGDGGQLP